MLLSSGNWSGLLDYVRRETKMSNANEHQKAVQSKPGYTKVEAGPMPKGKLAIWKENVHTGKSELVEVANLVVDNAKNIMAHLLGSAAVADWGIAKMVFGTGTTTPTETDVALEIPITPEKDVTVDYPDTTSVRFTATLESTEANGFPVAEAGLYSGSEGMFSRVVFGPLNKTSDFRFVFRWTIYW